MTPEILPFKRWQALLKLFYFLMMSTAPPSWQIPLQDRKTPLSIRFELQNSDSIYCSPIPVQ